MVRNSRKDDLPFILWNAVGNVSWARSSLRLNDRRNSNFRKDELELLVEG
jgi:hypothetical protein